MAGRTTLFMTPEESERVTKKFQHVVEQCKTRAGQPWKAEDRKGLIQHATSTSLMQELSLASLGFGGASINESGGDTMMTYAVGSSYPPCTAPAADLEPIKVPDLELQSHHRGKKLAVRRVSPVAELKASSWAVVEGLDGENPDHVVVVETFLHKKRLGSDILDTACEFVIKEPFYTLNNDCEPVVRVHHPSDLVITAFSEHPESWRDNYVLAAEDAATTPERCKEKGNAALGKQQLALAHAYYTRGITLTDSEAAANPASTLPQDLRRNRAHANLLLQRYDEAKADALESLTRGSSEEQQSLDAKAYFRAGTAAYALAQYEDAKKYFEEQHRLQPDSKTAGVNVRRASKRIEEAARGNHDLGKMAAGWARAPGKYPDVASYDGETVVKESPGAGRGLFAARDFKPGELILCEKAFCIVSSTDKAAPAVTALTVDVGDDDFTIRVFPAGLHRAVVQKLLDNPSQASKVLALDSGSVGSTDAAAMVNDDEGPVIDVFQVGQVVQRNAFGLGARSEDEDVSNATTGLWTRAAYLNHSCVANSVKEFAGDVMVVRAAADGRGIRAGEEITHAYEDTADYEARTASLQRTWGFRCRCALCVAEAGDGDEVRARRRALEREAGEFVRGYGNPTGAGIVASAKAKRLRKALGETYDEERFKGLPRLATRLLDEWLAIAQR